MRYRFITLSTLLLYKVLESARCSLPLPNLTTLKNALTVIKALTIQNFKALMHQLMNQCIDHITLRYQNRSDFADG